MIQLTICVPKEYTSIRNGPFLCYLQAQLLHTERSTDRNHAAAAGMGPHIGQEAFFISILILLSVSVLSNLCLVSITMCCSRRASDINFELQERGEGQGGHSEFQSHEVHHAGESQGSRIEHRVHEDRPDLEGHPDFQDHQGQNGHQSRVGHRNDEHISPSGRHSLRAI